VGLRTPPGGGPIAAEHSYVVLSDGSFYAVYRSIDGHPVEAYSRDGGHTWSVPQYRRYADGRLMKHPRAANFHWKCAPDARHPHGKYLYWFHNHGGRFIREHPRRRSMGYEDRNPVWFSGGVEVDSPEGVIVQWSQPEIGLYDDDPYLRMSYPDLVQEGDRIYLTETQKDKARVHEIAPDLLEGMWSQFDVAEVAQEGLILQLPQAGAAMPTTVPAPEIPPFLERDRNRADYGTKDLRRGFSVELAFHLDALAPGQTLLDSRTPDGQGFCLQTAAHGAIEIVLNDGRTENRWSCDPGLIHADKTQHLVAVVDAGPKIVTFVVDGKLDDGGDWRQFGWGRFSPHLRGVRGADSLRIASCVKGVRLYNRALRTSEAVGNYRAG
jgi:hypothetical protein